MTMVEAVILLGFGVPIAAACMAFVVMACRMQNEENAKLAAQHKYGGEARCKRSAILCILCG